MERLWSPWRYEYMTSSGGEDSQSQGCVFCGIEKAPDHDETNFVLYRASRNFVVLNIYPYISGPEDEAVDFLFMVDKINLEKFDQVKVEGNGTHLLGSFPLDGTQFIFPFTSHA